MIDGPQFMGIARAIACGVGDAATPQDIKDALNYGLAVKAFVGVEPDTSDIGFRAVASIHDLE